MNEMIKALFDAQAGDKSLEYLRGYRDGVRETINSKRVEAMESAAVDDDAFALLNEYIIERVANDR